MLDLKRVLPLTSVCLVSSAPRDLFPDNTMASFGTRLRESLNLDGERGVALSEIKYPCFIRNATKGVTNTTRLKKMDRKSGMNECNKVKKGIFLTLRGQSIPFCVKAKVAIKELGKLHAYT